MAEDFETDITHHEKITKRPKHVEEFEFTPDFQAFLDELAAEAEDGTPLTHIIATAVMGLFHPGFVIIGSPYMEPTEEGILIPESIGISLTTRNDMTPTALAVILKKLSEDMLNDFEEDMEKLNDSF